MAFYVDSKIVVVAQDKPHWHTLHQPGAKVPMSGIYICVGCNDEVTSNEGDPFPPQNHHQHEKSQGDIRWKLLVRTNTKGK